MLGPKPPHGSHLITVKHGTPEGATSAAPKPEELAICIRELLDCYWGNGDGAPPPDSRDTTANNRTDPTPHTTH